MADTQVEQHDPEEPHLTEFASELTAAAQDALRVLGEPIRSQAISRATHGDGAKLQRIMRIPVTMRVVVGSATFNVEDLKNLAKGDAIALDRRVGEPVEIVINGQVFARGMLVIVDQETSRLGVSLTEIVDASDPARDSRPWKA